MQDAKVAAQRHGVDFGVVCSYVLPSLWRIVVDVCAVDRAKMRDAAVSDALSVVLRCAFFCYSLHPTVVGSRSIAGMCHAAVERLNSDASGDARRGFERSVYEEATSFMENAFVSGQMRSDEGAHLEVLNLIAVLGMLKFESPSYRHLLRWVAPGKSSHDLGYFQIVTLMSFLSSRRDRPDYASGWREVVEIAKRRFVGRSLAELADRSDLVHLFFDFLACTCVDRDHRLAVLDAGLKSIGTRVDVAELPAVLEILEAHHWWTHWEDFSMLKALRRRAQTTVY